MHLRSYFLEDNTLMNSILDIILYLLLWYEYLVYYSYHLYPSSQYSLLTIFSFFMA